MKIKAYLTAILPVFKWKRFLTPKEKIHYISTTLSNIWLFVWVIYLLFHIYNPFTEYRYIDKIEVGTQDYTDRLEKSVENALSKLKTLDMSIDDKVKIEFCKDNICYFLKLFPGFQTMAIGTTAYTIDNTITFRNIDMHKEKYFLDNEKKYKGNFSTLLVHELVHTWQYETYGLLSTFFMMPIWVKEGYAVYVSNDTELTKMLYEELKVKNIFEFLNLYLKKNSEIFKHTMPDYLFYSIMVKHAIEKMDKSVDDLHLGKVNYDEVLESLLKEYNITQSKQ